MRVESTVAQQALLAVTARKSARGGRADRAAAGPDATSPAPAPAPAPSPAAPAANAESQLPSAVADRLASFFAADPGFAAAVSAQLPAARQASARDLAAYSRTGHPRVPPGLINLVG